MEIDDKRYKYIYDPSDNGVEELPVGRRFVAALLHQRRWEISPHSGMANKAIDSPMSHLMPTTKQSPASHVSTNTISSMYFKRITDLLFFS